MNADERETTERLIFVLSRLADALERSASAHEVSAVLSKTPQGYTPPIADLTDVAKVKRS